MQMKKPSQSHSEKNQAIRKSDKKIITLKRKETTKSKESKTMQTYKDH